MVATPPASPSTDNARSDPEVDGSAGRSRFSLKGKLVTASVVAAAALAVVTGIGIASASAASSTHNWIETGWNIHLANQADSATASHFFNTSGSFGTGAASAASPVQDGFSTSAVLTYSSYAQFASDVQNNAITYPYRWVMYDAESWTQTPLNEQRSPAKYMRLFGKLAHAKGYKVIETPARDLGGVKGSACPAKSGENLNVWYVRCNIAGAAAANSDVYVLQDQVNTSDVSAYSSLFTSVRKQALAANPKVAVDSEVSTNYGSASGMAAAAQSVNADGFYLSVTSSAIGQADQFLQEMQTAGY